MGKISEGYARRALAALIPTMVVDGKDKPVIVRGSGILVEDVEGQEYMDFLAGPGVVATGHCHPEVVAAGQEQLATLTQSPGVSLNPNAIALAERISGLVPGGLKRTFFCNSGAEANEGAIKLAVKYATRHGKNDAKIICLEHAFHGRLSLSLSLTDFNKWKSGLDGFLNSTVLVRAPAPYYYRSPYESEADCEDATVQAIEDAMAENGTENIAAVIMEPIPGVGGVIVPPSGYLRRVAQLCQRYGISLIHDEVFTGFGRTGTWFAGEHFGVVPDIMAIGKTVGGGMPLGGFVATEERAAAFQPTDHNTTFGGNNSVALVMGLKVLEIIERDHLVENARIRGGQLMEGIRSLGERFDIIGEARGRGLFIGVEIVEDKQTKVPGEDKAGQIRQHLQEAGVIVGLCGNAANVVKISPPLIVGDEHIDRFLAAFAKAMEAVC